MLTWTPELRDAWRADLERTGYGQLDDRGAPAAFVARREPELDPTLPPKLARLLAFTGPLAHDEFCARVASHLVSWGYLVTECARIWQISDTALGWWLRMRPDTRRRAGLSVGGQS